jgi:hypothetical protein
MFKSKGHLQVKDGAVRIVAGLDLIKYYHNLVNFHNYRTQRLQLPAHGAHITVVNPKIHRGININPAKEFDGWEVEFDYFPEDMYVSRVNYWIPVKCVFADFLKRKLKVDDGENYWGLHLTVCNKKFNE